MLKWMIRKKLDSVERRLGVSVDYLRHLLGVSLSAFFKFTKIMPIAAYRRVLPREAAHVARIVAVRDEDCGTCLQVAVNISVQEGVPRHTLQAVLDSRPEMLPEPLADVYRFTEAVVRSSPEADKLRDRIRRHYGDAGLVELALAIASSRFFPIVKRTLGFATSCAEVQVKI